MENTASVSMKRLMDDLETYAGKGIVSAKPGEAVVEVPLLTSSAASFYERMRSIVDNKEQHVIRWHTISRTLGRLLRHSEDDAFVSLELLKELVADGFLPNKTVPVSTAGKIQYIILKYRVLRKRFDIPELFTIAVSEVEAILYGNRNEAYVEVLYESVRDTIVYEGESGEKKKTFFDAPVYLACRRALFEDDESALLYGMWLKHFPSWETLVDLGDKDIDRIPSVLQFSLGEIADPTYRRIARKLRDQAIYVTVLKGWWEGKSGGTANEASLEKELAETVRLLSDAQTDAVHSMGMRSFWYILVTKTAIILPIEYFLATLLFPPAEMFPLAVNLVFHPALLLLMTRTIRSPKRMNTDMIVSGVQRLVSGKPADPVRIKPAQKIRMGAIALYAVVAVGIFSLVVWLLEKMGFTPVSVLFFVILLAVISFFAFRVRSKAKKFVLRRYEEMRPSNFWFSVATIPFIDAGRRLSDGFRAINIFTEVMDIFIEVPFKTLIKTVSSFLPFAESVTLRVLNFLIIAPIAFLLGVKKSFSTFIKEKKEEID